MPNAPPRRLRAGAVLDHAGLREATREAVKAHGRTQKEIAEALEVTPAAVSNAVNLEGPAYERLQLRLIEALTPYRGTGPFFRLERK